MVPLPSLSVPSQTAELFRAGMIVISFDVVGFASRICFCVLRKLQRLCG